MRKTFFFKWKKKSVLRIKCLILSSLTITKQEEESKHSCKDNSGSVSPKEWGHSKWFLHRGLRLKPLERTPSYSYTVYNSAGHLLTDCVLSSCSGLTCAPSKKTSVCLNSTLHFWRTRQDKPLKAHLFHETPLPQNPPLLSPTRTRNSCQRRTEKRPSPKWKSPFPPLVQSEASLEPSLREKRP